MNSNSGETFFFVLMAVVFLASIGIAFFQKSKRDQLLVNQAGKRGGEVVKNGLLSRSELRLPYMGNTLVIYCRPGSRNSPPRTIATLRPEGRILPTLDILRNDLVQKIVGKFGRERIPLDNEEFDRQIVVRGDDSYLARRVLTPDLQQRFLDRSLRALEVRVSPQNIQIKMLAIPASDDAFDYFIDTTLAILQKIL